MCCAPLPTRRARRSTSRPPRSASCSRGRARRCGNRSESPMRDPNDLRAVLESERHSAQPRPGAFDRLLRIRRRRQQRARIGAGALALALAALALWGAAAAFRSSPPRPAKPGPTINVDTVANLHLVWWGADLLDAEPVQ